MAESPAVPVVGVLDWLVGTLERYQRTPSHCRHTALAITKLEEAKHWLDAHQVECRTAPDASTAPPRVVRFEDIAAWLRTYGTADGLHQWAREGQR